MKPVAIEAADARVQRARGTISIMERSDVPIRDIESAWWTFLLAASGVYSKLEQGAKGAGKSEAWFGRVKHTRKNDPLLSYLHHARNSEEHSLETTASAGVASIESRHPSVRVSGLTDDPPSIDIDIHSALESDEPIGTITIGVCIRPVKDDRFGDTFPIPKTHLGKPLSSRDVSYIAKLGLAHLEHLVVEARSLSSQD